MLANAPLRRDPARADEEEIEDEAKKRSTTKDGMGAKTLCIPLEQVRAALRRGASAHSVRWDCALRS